jgi:hypothetical protein
MRCASNRVMCQSNTRAVYNQQEWSMLSNLTYRSRSIDAVIRKDVHEKEDKAQGYRQPIAKSEVVLLVRL